MVDALEFGELRFDSTSKGNIERVLERNHTIGASQEVVQYAVEWGKLFGYEYNIPTSSGTSADIVACKTLWDLNAQHSTDLMDNEIIAPALAFVAVGSSILDAGFFPRFVDVKRETLNIDPEKIEEAITSETRAIMAVHTMGKPCEMDKIMKIARENDLYVIEDSCEAHGAQYKGNFIGKFGDMAAFSSYIAHLICSMEGGMLSTDN